jgi:hypothetical protein
VVLRVQEHVLRLDIAMDYPGPMGFVERRSQVGDNAGDDIQS